MNSFKHLSDKEWASLCLAENSRRVFIKMKDLRESGKFPTPTKEELEDEPTALANSSYREKHESNPLNQLLSSLSKGINNAEILLEETGDFFYGDIITEMKQIRYKIESFNKEDGK
jgi:hypothetical protein